MLEDKLRRKYFNLRNRDEMRNLKYYEHTYIGRTFVIQTSTGRSTVRRQRLVGHVAAMGTHTTRAEFLWTNLFRNVRLKKMRRTESRQSVVQLTGAWNGLQFTSASLKW